MQYAPGHLCTLLRAAPIALKQTAEPLKVEEWGWVQPSLEASVMYVRGSLSSDFASRTISGLPSLPSNKKSMNPFAHFSKSAPRRSMCSGFSLTFGSRITFAGPLLSSKKRQPAASSSRLILILAVASLRSTNAHPPRKFSHHCAFGINPTVNPNNRPIFPKVSSVGFAVPASISATWRLVSDSVLANSPCVKPSPLRISTTASGNLKSPVRARSASVRRFSRISSFVGFLHRAI